MIIVKNVLSTQNNMKGGRSKKKSISDSTSNYDIDDDETLEYYKMNNQKDYTNFYLYLMSGIVILIIIVAIVLYTIEYIKKKKDEKKKQERNDATISNQEKSQLRSIRQRIESFDSDFMDDVLDLDIMSNNTKEIETEEIDCEKKFRKLIDIPKDKKNKNDYLLYDKTVKELKEKCFKCKNKEKRLKKKKRELEKKLNDIQEEIYENKYGDTEEQAEMEKLQKIKNKIEEKYNNKENFGNYRNPDKFLYNSIDTNYKKL